MSMTTHLYVGIDGGGTTCKLRLENAAGKLLAETGAGPANIALSVPESLASIKAALDDALHIAALSGEVVLHACLGLAGTEDALALAELHQASHPFTSLRVVSDAHIACVGAHEHADGAIVIVGTGIIGYALAGGGARSVSGWGLACGDVGGGAWLGQQVVRHVARWQDGRTPKTRVLQAVFDYFNASKSALVSFATHATPTAFAKLAPFLVEGAKKKDPIALSLMQQAADEIASIYETLCRGDALPLYLHGGITSYLMPFLSDAVKRHLVSPKYTPLEAASILARTMHEVVA